VELSKLPKVSVIVSVFNGEKTIFRCLSSIFELDYPGFEVIVVNDKSTDKTEKIIRDFFPAVRLERANKNMGQALCRNYGVEIAKSEYIAFVDADVIVDKDWLKQLMLYPIIAQGGRQLCPADVTPTQRRIFKILDFVGFCGGKEDKFCNHLPTCNIVYKKSIFQSLGGFKDLRIGEDVDFNKRMGISIFYNPRAICYHYPPETLKAFLKKMYHYGKAQGRLVRQYGLFRKIHIIPFLTLGVLCAIVLILLLKRMG
jgi:glycosyltransferase involved in cell wall biosynthesis